MMKSVPPGNGLKEGQQATMLTTECACGTELRQGSAGTTCRRCGGAILQPTGP